MSNPFIAGTMNMNPAEFFGRKAEIHHVVNRLKKLQSTSVVGKRRIGKSSLLYHFYQTGCIRLGEKYRFVYVDLQEAKNHINVQQLFTNILEELKIKFTPQESIPQNLIEFSNSIEHVKQDGTNLVLLFDEFEELIQHRDAFPEDFFDQMRATLYKGAMAMVTSSKMSLREICLTGKLSSPFYNIFSRLDLNEFTEEEASEFIIAEREIEPFSYDELEFIASYPHWRHPLVLQIICYHVVENRTKHLIERDLENVIKTDAENYFAYGVINYARRQKGIALKILKKIAMIAEEIGKPILTKHLGG